jgi:hypothetical protein
VVVCTRPRINDPSPPHPVTHHHGRRPPPHPLPLLTIHASSLPYSRNPLNTHHASRSLRPKQDQHQAGIVSCIAPPLRPTSHSPLWHSHAHTIQSNRRGGGGERERGGRKRETSARQLECVCNRKTHLEKGTVVADGTMQLGC